MLKLISSIREKAKRNTNIMFQGYQLPSCSRGLQKHMVKVKNMEDGISTTTTRPTPKPIESKLLFIPFRVTPILFQASRAFAKMVKYTFIIKMLIKKILRQEALSLR